MEKKYKDENTIKNWFDDKLNSRKTKIEDYIVSDLEVNRKVKFNSSMSIVPSHSGLFDINSEMALKLGGQTKRNLYRNNLKCLFMLREGLSELKDSYDYIFLDCQPSFDLITKNAIVACDYYLIPTKFDTLSTTGIINLKKKIDKLLNDIEESNNKFSFNQDKLSPKLLGVVGNMVNVRNGEELIAFNENASNILKHKDEDNGIDYRLFKSRIRNNPEFLDMGDLIPAVLKTADSKTKKSVKREIEQVVEEFEERINGES